MSGTSEPSIHRLRSRAERALEDGRPRRELLSLLDRLVTAAPDGSEHSLFAHRQLAELRLEDHPWRAALHLRRLLVAGAADDGVYALLGLCHALLGNLRMSIACYRDALTLAPRNPWYHHNVGHLLDVGLDQPRRALDHLRTAAKLEPVEDEVTASLAHCLARVGSMDEARELANKAIEMAPKNADHRALLDWIDRGAPAGERAIRRSATEPEIKRAVVPLSDADDERVRDAFVSRMQASGFSDEQIQGARAIWSDFSEGRELRMQKPEAIAAAIELTVGWVHELTHVTQADVARRYGVTKSSLSQRHREIRKALNVALRDPRY